MIKATDLPAVRAGIEASTLKASTETADAKQEKAVGATEKQIHAYPSRKLVLENGRYGAAPLDK